MARFNLMECLQKLNCKTVAAGSGPMASRGQQNAHWAKILSQAKKRFV